MIKLIKNIPLNFKIIICVAFFGIIYIIFSNYNLKKLYIKNSIITKAEITEIKRNSSESDGFPGKTDNTLIFIKYKFTYKSEIFEGEGMWIPGEFYYISPNDKYVLVQFLKDNPKENRMMKSNNGVNLITN